MKTQSLGKGIFLTLAAMNHNAIASRNKYAPVFIIVIFVLLISFLTRIGLVIAFGKDMHVSFSFTGSFFIGFVYDLLIASFIVLPFLIHITFTNDLIYTKWGKTIGILFFIALLCLLFFTNVFPRDYNKDLYKALEIFVAVRFAIYLFLCTRSLEFRQKWRSFILQFWIFITVFLLLFNAVSEIVFWQEFSCRYNFIAVDYLVYTNEVLGNIWESYPILLIITIILLISLIFFLPIRKYLKGSVKNYYSAGKKLIYAVGFLASTLMLSLLIKPNWISFSKNNYANELSANGLYQFAQAFKNNELDFYKFYKTLPDSTAFNVVRNELTNSATTFTPGDILSIERTISDSLPERKMNVVLITVESLSASFLKAFGNNKNITPGLDSLANHSLFFTNMYASGTRTVRGLEALALSIPPIPGESIIKQANNENLFSLGSVFRSKGYISQFIYGGYSYFDNMNYFFSHNGYDVIDRSALSAEEIHYSNIWGVADEDLFGLSLRTMDHNYSSGKPFFTQIMTVSNHRPFTYPDGRIDIPSSDQSREGGVKYTDYAIVDFIKKSSTKPWFSNTVFVIVADHCAQSAGKVKLPVTGYHIPLLIYSPAIIKPQVINTLVAQIDIPPTLLGLLHFSYNSKFFGQNVLDSLPQRQKVFISTYEGLGIFMDSALIIQSPVRKVKAYLPDFKTGDNVEIPIGNKLEEKAISFYQVAAFLIRNKKYNYH